MSDFGKRLIDRLEAAANRNQTILDNNQAALDDNEAATHKLTDIVLPVLEKEGDQIALAAMREVYSLLEKDAEERQSTIEELKETKDLLVRSAALLKKSAAMLEQAGFDFSNIQQFSNDEIWLADHLDTIIRFVDIVNLQKLEVALDRSEQHRFEDFSHTVNRSGEKRQAAAEEGVQGSGVREEQEAAAAEAALTAIDAIKTATELRDALVEPPTQGDAAEPGGSPT